jgi:hypothetical protein
MGIAKSLSRIRIVPAQICIEICVVEVQVALAVLKAKFRSTRRLGQVILRAN